MSTWADGTAAMIKENVNNATELRRYLGKSGLQAYNNTYKPTDSPKAFRQIYDMSRVGAPFDRAIRVALGDISQEAAQAAWQAGKTDAQAGTLKSQRDFTPKEENGTLEETPDFLNLSEPADEKTRKENARQYLLNSLDQVVRGNYSEDVTLLGTAGQIGLGKYDVGRSC